MPLSDDTLTLPSGRSIHVHMGRLSIGPDLVPCYGYDGRIRSGDADEDGFDLPLPKEDREYLAALAITHWKKFAEQP